MVYTVAEISEQLNLSKVSIYSKLKQNELKNHIAKRQGVTYIDEIGFKLIKDNFNDFNKNDIKDLKDFKDLKNKEPDNKLNKGYEEDTEYLSYLKADINYLKDQMDQKDLQLKDQLKEKDLQLDTQLKGKDLQLNKQLNVKDLQLNAKDLQINNLNERLKQALELNRNSQVLLKDKPHEDILLLEEHFQELDTKLEEVKENMQHRKEHQKSKGFFNKIFGGTDKS